MRVQAEHWAVLLDYCELHPELITNKYQSGSGKHDFNKLWAELTLLLNALGLGEKTVDGWKKTLTDWKSKTKAKAGSVGDYQRKTGGSGPCSIVINSFEERLLKLMGRTAIEGNINIRKIGFKKRKIDNLAQYHKPSTTISTCSNLELLSQANSYEGIATMIPSFEKMNSTFQTRETVVLPSTHSTTISSSSTVLSLRDTTSSFKTKETIIAPPCTSSITISSMDNFLLQGDTNSSATGTFLATPNTNSVAMSTDNILLHDNFNELLSTPAATNSAAVSNICNKAKKSRKVNENSVDKIKLMNDEVLEVLNHINNNLTNLNNIISDFLPVLKQIARK